MSALVRFPIVQAGLSAAPTLGVAALAVFWNGEAFFLIPQTFLASAVASAVSAAWSNRQWGLHGFLAGMIAIVFSFITFILLVD
jgi:hypothetical protein